MKMKDSGIEWIGEIPETWEVASNKFVMTKIKQIISKYTGEPILSLSMSGVHERKLDGGGKMPATFDGYQAVKRGNLLLCLFDIDVTPRCVGYIQTDGITSPAYSQYEVNDNNSVKYYYYYYLMIDNNKVLVHLTKSLRNTINTAQFDNIKAIVPPKLEQQQIANFLDRKTTEIDELIDKINIEIDTLKQYQSSVITQAVTKGLDPNVQMKDSGIEWIGEIPETWEIAPLYKYFSERKNKNHTGNEKNLLSLSYGRIVCKNIESKGGLLPESFTTYNIIEPGDIIIRPTDLQNDTRSLRTGLSNEHGIITSAYIDLAPESKTNSRYYHYLLHSYDIQKVFYNMGNGVRQGLNYSEFSKLRVPIPEQTEQRQIADYLDQKVAKIQKIIKSKQQQINQLTEYKNSLIFEYVTGKKQVKEAN